MQENIKQVIVKNTVRKEFKTAPIWQWDTGHVLVFEGFDLPEAFQVHFAFSESGEAVTQIGSNDQVTVPDALVEDGRMIYAWLYISTEDAGLTKFLILMPVNRRAKPTHQVPPPVEQSEIDQAIAALNTGVTRAETAAENAEQSEGNAYQYAENAYNSSEAAASAAESAEGDARTATQKAQEALTAALDADRKAQNASESAQLASQKASEASGYADGLAEAVRTANEAKQTAVNKATEATQSASNAAQKAQEALSTAQAAEGSANDADTAKRGAETAMEAAQGYAGNASIMAQEANQSKNTAVEKAGEAEQSATNAAQSAQAAQQTAQQFSAKISEIDQELNTLSGDVSDLSDSLSEHEQYAEDTYAKQDGYYSDLTAGKAEQLVSSKLTEDQVPYKLRPAGGTNDIGNREYKGAIVGGTIAWNQLVRDEASDNETDYTGTDEHLTLANGRKYLTRISGTDSMVLGAGQEITAAKGADNVFDLTQMFGSAVADYVYGQGASYFRKWFPNAVYSYNAGELKHVEGLQSHDMVGFNLVDLSEFAKLYPSVCSMSGDELNCYSLAELFTTGIPVKLPYDVTSGYVSVELKTTTAINVRLRLSFSNGTYQEFGGTNSTTYVKYEGAFNRTARLIAIRLNWTVAGSFSVRNLCLNIAHNGSRNGEYEPYEKHSYPLDSSVILRGVPKVGANGVYWDGDRYLPDGTVERRYGVVDLGTINWLYRNSLFDGSLPNGKLTSTREGGTLAVCSKYAVFPIHWSSLAEGQACVGGGYVNSSTCSIVVKDSAYTDAASFKAAMQGVMLIYELATPTTESADPYRELQIVDDWGTEEFVTTGLVPVGHETQYPANLRDKLQHLPDLASSNGIYIVKQTDSEMELLKLPDMPTTNGNYRLKLNVASGSPTFSWEVVS